MYQIFKFQLNVLVITDRILDHRYAIDIFRHA
jgi:hypothetical protein